MKLYMALSKTVKDTRSLKIVKMYKSGKTMDEVGLAFNVSRERIRQILIKENCPRRKPTGPVYKERTIKSCAQCGKGMRLIPSTMIRRFCSSACYLAHKTKYHTEEERVDARRTSIRNYMRRVRGTKPENFRKGVIKVTTK